MDIISFRNYNKRRAGTRNMWKFGVKLVQKLDYFDNDKVGKSFMR